MAITDEQVAAIFDKLNKMEKRLFMDNGGHCLQSKVNQNEQYIIAQEKRWKWVFGTTTALFIMVLGRVIIEVLSKVR